MEAEGRLHTPVTGPFLEGSYAKSYHRDRQSGTPYCVQWHLDATGDGTSHLTLSALHKESHKNLLGCRLAQLSLQASWL